MLLAIQLIYLPMFSLEQGNRHKITQTILRILNQHFVLELLHARMVHYLMQPCTSDVWCILILLLLLPLPPLLLLLLPTTHSTYAKTITITETDPSADATTNACSISITRELQC